MISYSVRPRPYVAQSRLFPHLHRHVPPIPHKFMLLFIPPINMHLSALGFRRLISTVMCWLPEHIRLVGSVIWLFLQSCRELWLRMSFAETLGSLSSGITHKVHPQTQQAPHVRRYMRVLFSLCLLHLITGLLPSPNPLEHPAPSFQGRSQGQAAGLHQPG